MHSFLMWSEGLRGFGYVSLMIHTGVWIWVFALFPFYSLENPLHMTCQRLRHNAIWYDVSSTETSLFLSVTRSFLSFKVYLHVVSLHLLLLPKPCSLAFILSPSLLLFSFFLILILVSVFSEGGPWLKFVLLCNEQIPAVSVFLALRLRDSCQTQCKRGGHCISLFYSWRPEMCSMEVKKWNMRPFVLLFFCLCLLLPFSDVTLHFICTLYCSVICSLCLPYNSPIILYMRTQSNKCVCWITLTVFLYIFVYLLFLSCCVFPSCVVLTFFPFCAWNCPKLSSLPPFQFFFYHLFLPPVAYLIFASPSFVLSLSTPLHLFFLPLSFLQALVAPIVVSTVRSPFGPWGPQSSTLIPSMKNVSITTKAPWGAWARARGQTQALIATTLVWPLLFLYNQIQLCSLILAFLYFFHFILQYMCCIRQFYCNHKTE